MRWERSQVSDGNRRLTIESYARYPLGSERVRRVLGKRRCFAERSILYWDPEQYSAQGAGVEYAVRQARGFSFAARVLPSYAWSDESPIIASPDGVMLAVRSQDTTRSSSGRVTEAGYRVHGWEARVR